jgi:hypothetical protein
MTTISIGHDFIPRERIAAYAVLMKPCVAAAAGAKQ